MNSTLASLALCALPLLATAQDLPKLSPSAHVDQLVGLTKVSVDYSRPSAKGRSIFGDLVPFGEVWRTGANHCTTIAFDAPLSINGKEIPAGTYGLFTMPDAETWMVMLNKNADQWGATAYKAEENVYMTKAAAKLCDFTETFTIGFNNVTPDAADLELRWAKQSVSIHLSSDPTDRAMKNIDEALAKKDVTADTYNRSASFCVERGLRLKDAQVWAAKSVAMDKKYYSVFTLAECMAANGDVDGAVKEAQEAIDLATKADDKGAAANYTAKMQAWQKK